MGVVEKRGNREWGVGSRRRGIVLLLVLGFLCSALTPMAFAQEAPPEAEALDVGTYLRVGELRERLRLSDGTLAAMGLEQAGAEAVLGRLVTWCQTNAAQWTARRDAVADARKTLKAAIRQLNVGLSRASRGGLPAGAARPPLSPPLDLGSAVAVARGR